MVMRVAKALEQADDQTTPYDVLARVAIEAMRPELLRIVDSFDGRFDYPESVVFAVKEAIDAALTPHTDTMKQSQG